MPDIEIVSQTPLTLSELKLKLDKSIKGKKELSTRVTKVKEYLENFAPLSLDEVKKLKEKFETLGIQRLKERIIIKIIDIQPKTVDELKILFAGENVTLKLDDLTKIIGLIQEK